MSKSSVPTIGVDAMGGDFGPSVVVSGVTQALADFPGRFKVVLLGDKDEIQHELRKLRLAEDESLRIVHAPERIEMADAAATAFRRRPNSSLVVGTQLQKSGEVDALFSTGNTGAVVAIQLLGLGRLERVQRPAIAAVFPSKQKGTVVLDVGATADCKPQHLAQFAEMGTAYAQYVLDKADPRVGLLSIGEEKSKGNEVVQQAHVLLESLEGLNFIGNVEGRDILEGTVDVVVTDGFTGNVVLKLAESVAKHVTQIFRREMTASVSSRIGAWMLKPAFVRLRNSIDYAEYGAAPLLGVDGVCFIGHGRSSPRAVRSALRGSATFVERRVNDHIRENLRAIYA
ncbi:MAG TPA: phosphate acyltransferase PlsX [Candidatus Eisenbacteria bacterium]|jgi:phosphate acyltransferase|nr:phosphate acyltransferase PlsX [Candidatus Eisenbacteria bacterium]